MQPGETISPIVIVLSILVSVGALTLLPAFWLTKRNKFSLGDLLGAILGMGACVSLMVVILREHLVSSEAMACLAFAEFMLVPSAIVFGSANRSRVEARSRNAASMIYLLGVTFILSLYPLVLVGLLLLDILPRQTEWINKTHPPEPPFSLLWITFAIYLTPILFQFAFWLGWFSRWLVLRVVEE